MAAEEDANDLFESGRDGFGREQGKGGEDEAALRTQARRCRQQKTPCDGFVLPFICRRRGHVLDGNPLNN